MSYKDNASNFTTLQPYKEPPYNGRNWGHKWHSLCSYHGKLKPSIAHFLISNFTKPGDTVLDPLCGVGTIPFEAALQGRIAVGNDLSELAFCVTKAKLEKSDYSNVITSIQELEIYINSKRCDTLFENAPYRDFGLNHTLKEYFHPETYIEIILARQYFLQKFSKISPAEATVFSALLHVLHGNRPYALSRTSHPLTPYAPKGEYIYKNVIQHIKNKIEISYSCTEFDSYKYGRAIWGDYTTLNGIYADAIITSPPFADSIKFYTQNWMRLWLCGWEPIDFKSANNKFLDTKQNLDFDIYLDFFDMCNRNLKPNGILILHLGLTKKIDMAAELLKRSENHFSKIYLGTESVTEIEKHGIKDKGGTLEHQFLFLRKKC